jgi:hypothetical protein
MKFKLPRQILSSEIASIISREMRKQDVPVLRMNAKQMKEVAAIDKTIARRGLSKDLVCKKLPGKLGHGIFLHPEAQPILKGQVIAPYSGELLLIPQNLLEDSLYAFEPLCKMVLTQEEQMRFDKKQRYHPRRHYALHVDALKKGNFTRFINHSDQPNVIAELFKIPANPYGLAPSPLEVIYLASKMIRPGEQLLVCYDGDDHSYWNTLDIKPIPITPRTFRLDTSLNLIG